MKPSAVKELRAVPQKDRKRIARRIEGLAKTPRPSGAGRLVGREEYRIRQGDYRILYLIDDAARTVEVLRIAGRDDVYR